MRSMWLFCILAFTFTATLAQAGVVYFMTTSHTEPGHVNVSAGGGTYWGNWRAYYNKSINGTNDSSLVYVYVNNSANPADYNTTGWYVLAVNSTYVFANSTVNSTGWAALNISGNSHSTPMQFWAAKDIDMQNSFIIQPFPLNAPTYLVNGSDRYYINITAPENATYGFVQGSYRYYDVLEGNKIFGTYAVIPYLIDSPYWDNNTFPKNLSYNEIALHAHNGFWNHLQFGLDNRKNATSELDCFKDNATLRTIGNYDKNKMTSYFNIIPTSHVSGNGALFPAYNDTTKAAVWNELGMRVDATLWGNDYELSSSRTTIRNIAYTCYFGNFNTTDENASSTFPRGPYYFNGAVNVTNGTRGIVEVFIAYRNGSYVSDKYSSYGSMSGFLNESYFRAQRNDAEYIFPTFLHSTELINETGGYNDTSPNSDASNLNLTIRLAKQYRAIFVTQSAVLFHPRSTETAAVAAARINATTNTSYTQWVWRLAVRNTNASAVNKIQLSPEWSRNDSFNITLPGQDFVELVYACEPQNSFSDPRYINKSAQPYIFTTGNVSINTCEYNSATGNYTVAFNGTGTNKVAYIYYNNTKDFDVMDSTASNTSAVIEVRNGTVQVTRNSFSAAYNSSTNVLNITIPTMSDHFMQVLAYSAPQAVAAEPSAAGTNAPVTAFSVKLKDGVKMRNLSLVSNTSYVTSFVIENNGNTTLSLTIETTEKFADVVPKSITLVPGQSKEIGLSIKPLAEGNYSFKVLVKSGKNVQELAFNLNIAERQKEEPEGVVTPVESDRVWIIAVIAFAFLFFVFRRWLVVK